MHQRGGQTTMTPRSRLCLSSRPTVQAVSPTEPIQEDMDDDVRREWGGLLQELQLAQLQLARIRQVVEVVDVAGDKKRKKEDDSDEGGTHPPRRPEERSSSNTPVAGHQTTGESHTDVRGDGEEDQGGHEEDDNDDVTHIVVVVFFTVEVHRFHGHHDGHQGDLNPHSHLVGSNRQDNSVTEDVRLAVPHPDRVVYSEGRGTLPEEFGQKAWTLVHVCHDNNVCSGPQNCRRFLFGKFWGFILLPQLINLFVVGSESTSDHKQIHITSHHQKQDQVMPTKHQQKQHRPLM